MTLVVDLPAPHEASLILDRLGKVLDPELDRPILDLGFVTSVTAEAGCVHVSMEMPTAWCSPNFAYMMAEDVRRELLSVGSVDDVQIHLENNVMADAIEHGVNSGQTFDEAFEGEAFESLGNLRGLFLRKGYVKRQEALLKRLLAAGLSFEDVCDLTVDAVSFQDGICFVTTASGRITQIQPKKIAQDYLDRRAQIGIDCSADAALFVDVKGGELSAEKLQAHLIHIRTVRLSMEANGSLCSSLLAATKAQNKSTRELVSVS